MQNTSTAQKLFLLFVLWLAIRGCNSPTTAPSISTVTDVTYMHLKETPVPPAVRSALDKLNSQNINANDFMYNTVDGTDDVPEQYKLALEAAKLTGPPCLVIRSKTKVLKTIKDPQTEEAVLEAAGYKPVTTPTPKSSAAIEYLQQGFILHALAD